LAVTHLFSQLGHARGTARPFQPAVSMNRHAAGVISPVLQPLQALHQHGNDIAVGDRADNATHETSSGSLCGDGSLGETKYLIDFFIFMVFNSININ
jgi:hypothetical protein